MCYDLSMKTIYFIRHAKSNWKEQGISDFDRPLNKRGKKDVPLMANRLKHFNIKPDLILSSPALRAKKTSQIISETLECDIGFNSKLYESSVEDYLQILRTLPKDINTLIVVAHNPEITLTCELLTDMILGTIPTSGIVGISCNIDSFEEIGEGCGKVLFFDYPKKHA